MASRRSFAPLGTSNGDSQGRMKLQGVVFDMDGTLCEPQNYMFGQMREALGITKQTDILDHIHALPEPAQSEAFAKVQQIESDAMVKQTPQAGLVTLMEFLDRVGVRKAICTRNFDAPVNHLLENHIPNHLSPFSPVVTRGFRPPKPSPAGILHIAHAWGIVDNANVPDTPPSERPLPLLMVGDSEDDVAAGRDAGAVTVFLTSPGKEELETDPRTDIVIKRLDELVGLLEKGLEARV
ncbi:hypothetical protein PRZ48_004312 [Zasmidium cellare]|uniref:Uncharacterized protein n=1 Tax=Zasmidium cellare TaxID=395010 RepID=A0ABR0EPF8_ZASCE|nr:hypothetical protein PRZ48_004312 [Zasmidium cellare]